MQRLPDGLTKETRQTPREKSAQRAIGELLQGGIVDPDQEQARIRRVDARMPQLDLPVQEEELQPLRQPRLGQSQTA